ncbi:Peptidase M10, metallopeptidase [Corchorus olitorius]|uniref:Peptidase M10, metallopeptidase n=1 Tax=Corchorus olitorius TaxID=93759 RepID=A0A1R3J3H8_9ROSI|nr:Peptidase M10, metallopeptidase [Corchorus olitorius]
MASKVILPFFSSLTLFFLLLPLLFQAVLAHPKDENSSSSFQFLEQLQGCQKGNKVKDINKVKKYLKHLGYLSYDINKTHADNNDHFDESLEHAIKTYQLNYNLKATGTLDLETVSKMMTPRCSVPDIINGTSRMNSGKQNQSKSIHDFPTQYTFFPNRLRWPRSKFSLTYAFLPGTRPDAIGPVARAFQTWVANTPFRFTRIMDPRRADLKISFERRDHGDGAPFDGPDGILAHAFAPTDGRLHYDADETWTVNSTPNSYHLESVALHEIGHLLALQHSSVRAASMYPTFKPGEIRGLHADDIIGMKVLYGSRVI